MKLCISSNKIRYVLLRGSFSETGINEFLRDLSMGRGSTAPIPGEKLPAIQPAEKWDGKDASLVVEEDIDLSDVNLDDDDSFGIPLRRKTVDEELWGEQFASHQHLAYIDI